MVYAILDHEGKIKKIWHKLNHFTSSSWARTQHSTNGYTIVAFEPKILVQFPITAEGIEQIRSFNSELPRNGKRGKATYRDKPEDIVPGVI